MSPAAGYIEATFAVLVAIQFSVMALHDWINIPGWTHGRQVYAALGPAKMWVGTVINSLFPGLALYYALRFWHQPKPGYVLTYWLVYCGITGLGAIQAWWLPYFRGTDENTKALYAQMYAGTIHVLPARGDNPRPNLLHLCFHALFLVTLVLSILLRLRVV